MANNSSARKRCFWAFCLVIVIVVMVVAIVGLTGTSSHSSKWYSQFDGNDTGEDHALAAIGQYANNIDSVAVDKAGRGKHKWGASTG